MTSFQIKECIDKYIYSIYNIYSFFSFFFKYRTKKILKRNVVFKDIHKSQRCFILGCGPSLKNIDPEHLSFLKNEMIIGVNDLFRTPFLRDIIPQYYFMLDNAYWTDQIDTAFAAIDFYKNKKTVFFTHVKAYDFLGKKVSKSSTMYYLYSGLYPVKRVLNSLDKNQTISINVVTQAILSAMYMGFKEIYLLGCDYTAFATPLDTHCYDSSETPYKTQNLAFYLKYYELATNIHYMVAQKALKEHVSIFNLTDNSLLDAYPKKKLSDLF